MKKYRLSLPLFALLALVLFSCQKEEEQLTGVIQEMMIFFSVCDANGNDLLDPENENNILEDITLTYNKKTYPVDFDLQNRLDDWSSGNGRFPHEINGLLQLLSVKWVRTYVGFVIADKYYLIIGPMSARVERDEDYIIDWGDGSKEIIHYYYHFDTKKRKASRRVTINGKPHEGDKIYVRLDFIK